MEIKSVPFNNDEIEALNKYAKVRNCSFAEGVRRAVRACHNLDEDLKGA